MSVNAPDRDKTSSPSICKVASCNKPIKAKMLCDKHLKRVERNKTVKLKNLMMQDNDLDECLVPGCTAKPKSKGICQCHYAYYLRNGIPIKPKVIRRCGVEGCMRTTLAKRLCGRHLYRFNKREHLDIENKDEEGYPKEAKLEKYCGVKDCKEPYYGQGMCLNHSLEYDRAMKKLKDRSV